MGANCGLIGDGCGGVIDCGTCPVGRACGSTGVPNQCGLGQVMCPGGGTTSLSGTAYLPTPPQFGPPDPLYGARVYVPGAPLPPFQPGVSCDRCDAAASGNPIVSTLTDVHGAFRLDNVPVGPDIPLVVQIGRWRRRVVIPMVNECQDNEVPANLLRLPRNQTEGDIPHIAMVTGDVDPLECVLRKIGIEDAEFTDPAGNGRVHFYLNNGATAGPGTLDQSDLWSEPGRLDQYDIVIEACEGGQTPRRPAELMALVDFTSRGGRFFATHWNFVWLDAIDPFRGTAMWASQMQHDTFPEPDPLPAMIDTSFPKGMALAEWLAAVGALTGPSRIDIFNPRHDVNATQGPGRRWIYTPMPSAVQHYTFNTPVSAAEDQQCGRVVFSSFHVTASTPGTFPHTGGMAFPRECATAPLTPQEKVIVFMLFDAASCITPDIPPGCVPRTCAQAGANCGPIGDGCGNIVECGACTAPDTCGGAGQANVCGHIG